MVTTDVERVCAALSADDLLVFRRVDDELEVIGGHGRGAGWAGIVTARIADEPRLRTLAGGRVVRVGGTAPQHVIGPYWSAAAVLVPVGDDHVVVFGGPRLARASDGELLRFATEAVAASRGVPAEKLLADELEVVHALRRLMDHRPESVTETARHVAEVAAEALSCDVGAIFVERQGEPIVVVTTGAADAADGVEDAGLLAALRRLAQRASVAPVVEQDVPAGTRIGDVELASQLALRFTTADGTGLLLVGHARDRPRGFTTLCQRIGRSIADAAEGLIGQAAVREQLAAERDRFANAARTDALTGLGNRTAWDEALRRADSTPDVAVVIADVNGLKRTNDTLGLAAGDALVLGAGWALRSVVRDADVVARLGGDEFGVLLRLRDPDDLDGVVRRIDEACRSVVGSGAGGAPLQLAIGAALRADGEPLVDTQRRADERMRADKRRHHEAALVG